MRRDLCDFFVRNIIAPVNDKDLAKAFSVESVKFLFSTYFEVPHFASVELGRYNICVIKAEFRIQGKFLAVANFPN